MKIPKIVVPVSSGRSMSVIIEAAVMNMRLREYGVDSSKEFVERILKNIDKNEVDLTFRIVKHFYKLEVFQLPGMLS